LVSRKLRMSAEIGDWLTDLCADEVATATEVGAAIVTLLEAPDLPGPALVTDPAINPASTLAHQAAALDAAQQSLQWALRLSRTAASEAATDVTTALHDVRELERQPGHSATETPADSPGAGAPSLAPGLLELRADPLGGDIRLLFAMEPPDTVTVLAVLEGEGAVHVHRDKALSLASDLLIEIRSGEWPPARGRQHRRHRADLRGLGHVQPEILRRER
jgi:hypothetical protein